ncbi:hypothetical protein EW146_g1042 [Bondarzewia mesenterica]|uniref:AB hydrolase-1 domain-containing protein n=1 Tax=Bondarzewia mesenterica TaxID=1095465 RepID=A0A4S4M571_9AGAM|nr:hypothetical protein EW146_g1042 [Bondarzewia mesenterica]
MSFTNITDPAGVQALLDTLRKSQAFADAINSNGNAPTTSALDAPRPSTSTASSQSGPSTLTNSTHYTAVSSTPAPSTSGAPTVAELLSQLQSSSSFAPAIPPISRPQEPSAPPDLATAFHAPSSASASHVSEQRPPAIGVSTPTPPARTQDVRLFSFQQSLPHITKLVEDRKVVDAVTFWGARMEMKKEQEKLEKQLWEERLAIKRKHEEKVKVARTKAQMIGGLTKHEADTMAASFRKELNKFDQERALRAWEGLIAKQQNALEVLGVPTMFVTDNKMDTEARIYFDSVCDSSDGPLQKQQRVMQVLEGVVGEREFRRPTFHSAPGRPISSKSLHASSPESYWLPTIARWTIYLARESRTLVSTYYNATTPSESHGLFSKFPPPFSSPLSSQSGMPYVDLVADDDYFQLWYTTNTFLNSVSDFHPDKPTVIMLHPMAFDSKWLHNLLGDPRLNHNYNLIAFDARYSGRSKSRPSGKLDHWVEAADLAFACQVLYLPPAHVWAEESLATNVALRFAALFPDMCLSLTLVTVPPPTELKSYFTSFDEMVEMWSFAEDLDSFEHAAMEFLNLTVGSDVDPDLMDDIIAYWTVTYPPFRRSSLISLGNTLMNRTPLTGQELGAIKQPVLIVHGEKNELHPLKYAERLVLDLVNVEGGATLYTVRGSHGYLSLLPSCASIINQVFFKFLSRLPHAPSGLQKPLFPVAERMTAALQTLADLTNDLTIVERNPMSSMSFSLVPPDVQKYQADALQHYNAGQNKAFSPLGSDGRPIRKYSERREDHWFHGDHDGMSYAGEAHGLKLHMHPSLHHRPVAPPNSSPGTNHRGNTEPASMEMIQDSRARRTMLNPRTVDQFVIKGSMLKMVTASASMPMTRLLG